MEVWFYFPILDPRGKRFYKRYPCYELNLPLGEARSKLLKNKSALLKASFFSRNNGDNLHKTPPLDESLFLKNNS